MWTMSKIRFILCCKEIRHTHFENDNSTIACKLILHVLFITMRGETSPSESCGLLYNINTPIISYMTSIMLQGRELNDCYSSMLYIVMDDAI